MLKQNSCPLCGSIETNHFYTSVDKGNAREFWRCYDCDLVSVPHRFHLDELAQKKRYLKHNNDPNDPEYRKFLSRLVDPLKPVLLPNMVGLDYGAGPGPALATMMRESGFDIRLYDPIFFRDPSALDRCYDFITCTETVEHMANPIEDFRVLDRLLKPSGWFGVMTSMLDSWDDFPNWYYHRDPTHICFYNKRTMAWIGRRFGWEVLIPRPNVVLFHKSVQ